MATSTCATCRKDYSSLGIMRHRTMHSEDATRAKGDVIYTVHDGDCPHCGFPETIIVRDDETMEPLRELCSKRSCHWQRKINA